MTGDKKDQKPADQYADQRKERKERKDREAIEKALQASRGDFAGRKKLY